jgi:ADP-ribosylglycohydrolase/protein-tyrosine phosphatase
MIEAMGGIDLGDRLEGAVWGHVVGDAVGVPYEFKDSSDIDEVRFGAKGTHRQPPGTWSDDGALMLALLDSLLSVGFDATDQGQRSLAWFRNGAYAPDGNVFDFGNATSEALGAIEQGVAAEDAGPTDEWSNGNGSLMRILPLALVLRDIPDRSLIELAHRASRVTHGTALAQVACALYCIVARRLIAMALDADPTHALEDARSTLRAAYGDSERWGEHRAALETIETWPDRGGRGYVVDSFWSAWDAFAGAASYEETVERAVRYGNDTDTTAAIAGGLAGIRWGIDGIPTEWLGSMRGVDIARPLVDRLLDAGGYQTSTGNPIRVNWVEFGSVPKLRSSPGRLGMTFLPGKRYEGINGSHHRDLAADVARLRDVYGIDVFLLLVEDAELVETRTTGLGPAMAKADIELRRHPVSDMDVPEDPVGFAATLANIRRELEGGRSVAVACLGGLGRTGTAVGCLLVDRGLDADAAIALTRASREGTIETERQEQFVRDWRRMRKQSSD